MRHQPTRQKLRICLANASWCLVLAFSPHLQSRVFTSSPQTLTAFRFYPFPSAEMYILLFIFSLLNIIFSLFQLRKRTQATTKENTPISRLPPNTPMQLQMRLLIPHRHNLLRGPPRRCQESHVPPRIRRNEKKLTSQAANPS